MTKKTEFAERVWDIPYSNLESSSVRFLLFMSIGIRKLYPEIETVYIMLFTQVIFSLRISQPVEFAMNPIKRHFLRERTWN